jgi:dolichol-phosphate mannosyltransferase
MKKPHISVVSPVYGCVQALPELCARLHAELSKITNNYEIILVNDASPDASWDVICQYAEIDKRIKGINLSRNFGQHYAVTAGLDFAFGDWVVVMDCDLQDNPEEIVRLYEKANTGYDIVFACKSKRQDSWTKRNLSRLFFYIYQYLSERKVNARMGNFGIYSQKVIASIRLLKEQNRSFGLFALWVGYRRAEIDVIHSARFYGQTGYTFTKAISLAIDSILADSDKLLRLTIKFGFVVSFISMISALYIIFRYFMYAKSVEGWTSLFVSLYFATGLIIGTIGIVGLYVGKIFDEVKRRPLYIIDELTFDINTTPAEHTSAGSGSDS